MDEALVWFTRLRAGTVSEDERRAFAAWRERNPTHATAYARVEATRGASDLQAAVLRHRRFFGIAAERGKAVVQPGDRQA